MRVWTTLSVSLLMKERRETGRKFLKTSLSSWSAFRMGTTWASFSPSKLQVESERLTRVQKWGRRSSRFSLMRKAGRGSRDEPIDRIGWYRQPITFRSLPIISDRIGSENSKNCRYFSDHIGSENDRKTADFSSDPIFFPIRSFSEQQIVLLNT